MAGDAPPFRVPPPSRRITLRRDLTSPTQEPKLNGKTGSLKRPFSSGCASHGMPSRSASFSGWAEVEVHTTQALSVTPRGSAVTDAESG